MKLRNCVENTTQEYPRVFALLAFACQLSRFLVDWNDIDSVYRFGWDGGQLRNGIVCLSSLTIEWAFFFPLQYEMALDNDFM